MILIFAIFFKFFENFCHFSFLSFSKLQRPGNVLFGFLIEHCIVSSNSGLVFIIIISRNLLSWIKSAISENFCHFFMFPRFSGQEITFLVF